jgi:large subunit ribosomal protein L18e
MKRGIENKKLLELILELKKADKDIWKKVARELEKPTRRRPAVNVSKLEEYVNSGETVLVPGKVLGAGHLSKKLEVAAFSFSGSAKALIEKSGGKPLSIEALMKANPEGRNVRILV